MLALLTPAEISAFVEAHKWTYAKTMPHNPHFYVVKNRCRDPVEFERMVLTIHETGYTRRYGKLNYRTLNHQTGNVNYRYWLMPEPLGNVVIINRAVEAILNQDEVRRKVDAYFAGLVVRQRTTRSAAAEPVATA